ncbi:N-acetylmuramoyl-L-alanine amidase family protein [Paenibacillus sp. SC116]|uniref:N-acetylmuramoyl-L-alanine amidase family protein n=1 Tax=Paenibacillus sp. SC116 TaxID=2968986 RepID=UPI00215AC5B5|nr:N-acetylmuramoyl-L-alanine amidase family protein [Paenibacillus sp. SC116]
MQRERKLCVSLFLVMVMCLVFPSWTQAQAAPSLYLNGSSLHTTESIQIINGVVMVPIRIVSEELGYRVNWEGGKEQKVRISDNYKDITLEIGHKKGYVNGQVIDLAVAPKAVNGTTLVPLRFIGETFGLVVDWEHETKSVYLFTSDGSGSEVPEPPTSPGEGEDGTSTGKPGSNDTEVIDMNFYENTLHVALDREVTPKIMTMSNPERIVIDFPKANFSEQFREKFGFEDHMGQGTFSISDYPDVKQVRFSLFSNSPNTVRFVIDATQALSYRVSTSAQGLVSITLEHDTGQGNNNGGGTNGGDGGSVKPPVDPSKPTRPDGKYVVVLDAGHGAHDSGAVSVKKRYEKDFNLQMAKKTAEILRKDSRFHVVMTREEDRFLELKDRVKIANDLKADLFISFHGNSIAVPSVNGVETYYYRPESKAFAEVMHKHIMNGADMRDRGVKKGNFHVIRNTTMPGILLELGFLTNVSDEQKMFSAEFQNRVAGQIVKGIKDYLNVK